MSERALEFVEVWVEEKIAKLGKSSGAGKTQAAALAAECIKDARGAGVPEAEIKDAFDDLGAYLASEIEEANARKNRPDEVVSFVEGDDARIIDDGEDAAGGDK